MGIPWVYNYSDFQHFNDNDYTNWYNLSTSTVVRGVICSSLRTCIVLYVYQDHVFQVSKLLQWRKWHPVTRLQARKARAHLRSPISLIISLFIILCWDYCWCQDIYFCYSWPKHCGDIYTCIYYGKRIVHMFIFVSFVKYIGY